MLFFYENIFPGRNNDPFSNAQSSSFFHFLVISSHELSHSIVSNTSFPNVLSTKSDPTYPDIYETIFWLYSPSTIFCQSASCTTLSLQLYQYHHLLLLTYLLILVTKVYLCCLLYQQLHLVLRNPKLVAPSLKRFQITRCYTSHRCFSVFLMSSNLPFIAQQFLIQPG